MSYGQLVASWNQCADAKNLTPEQKQAGLDKLAKGELPERVNISKVIVDGYKDGVMIAGAWYLEPTVSVSKAVVGGVTSAAMNGGFQWYLLASAGRDASLMAARVSNGGQSAIVAGRDLSLGSVKIAEQENNVRNAGNYLKQGYVQDVGTDIATAGDVRLQAGRDLTAIAANVTSEQGALLVVARGDVGILAGEASSHWSEGRQHNSRSLLGSRQKSTRDSLEETTALAGTVSGDRVAVWGRNVTVTGSNLVSDAGTVTVAQNDLTIQAATESSSERHVRETRRSGVFSGGGIGFTVGKQMQSDDQKSVRTTAAASTVGSVGGNVSLSAGNQYRQIGSDVLAPEGDISVTAKNIEISEARQTGRFEQESKFKQSGLSISISSPVISAVEAT
ncbi:hemagglutinin repeat-containing protein [Edwardsiella hoshinae]|uniref:Filamentous hemagglutinin n=2 Tax=Edwardsiella hoshinae TaxID=93378 RepID=A0A376D849_9GAMM|nr:hemagglutinin repeat-containing protein [Edwardsiella hoshinae]QPR28182.1 hemagglutinin repeat-containing protein [Edwardsiella hoshinae]STC84521.1 Uncharacterised protein [Edwardsiella hoshinae]